MFKIIFLALTAALRSRRQLALENVALRHQLTVLQRNTKRPRRQHGRRLVRLVDVAQDARDGRRIQHEGDDPHGRAAVRALKRQAFVVAGQQPRVGGREACAAIRALRPEVPVLFASGYDPASMAADQELPVGVDTLLKPYGIPDLLQKVRATLDRQ